MKNKLTIFILTLLCCARSCRNTSGQLSEFCPIEFSVEEQKLVGEKISEVLHANNDLFPINHRAVACPNAALLANSHLDLDANAKPLRLFHLPRRDARRTAALCLWQVSFLTPPETARFVPKIRFDFFPAR